MYRLVNLLFLGLAASGFTAVDPVRLDSVTATHAYQRLQQHVDKFAEGYDGSALQIELLQPDVWDRLPQCPSPPQIRFSDINALGRISLTVVCASDGARGWKRRLAAKIDFLMPVYVTTVDLKKGEPLAGLNSVRRAFSSLGSSTLSRSFMKRSDPIAFTDYIALRPIKTGTVITADLVKKPFVVQKGSTVTIVASSNAVMITTSGMAQGSGRMGDIIQVKKDNGRVIPCQVINAREVRPHQGVNYE